MFKSDVWVLTMLLILSFCVFGTGIMVGHRIGLNSVNSSEFCNKE